MTCGRFSAGERLNQQQAHRLELSRERIEDEPPGLQGKNPSARLKVTVRRGVNPMPCQTSDGRTEYVAPLSARKRTVASPLGPRAMPSTYTMPMTPTLVVRTLSYYWS